MTPFTVGFLASVVANGLSTVVACVGKRSIRLLRKDKNSLLDAIARDSSLQSILQKATTAFARDVKVVSPAAQEGIKIFIASPDVDAIVRQIYATNLRPARRRDPMTPVRREFLACLFLHVGSQTDTTKRLGLALFEGIVKACDRALQVAIDKGFLSAHEARSAARANLILGEIAAI